MFKDIENLKIENIYKGSSAKQGTITSRKIATLVFRVSGNRLYDFYDRTFELNPGDIIFLPQGSSYEYKSQSDFPCGYVSINISADFLGSQPFAYSLEGFQEIDEIANNMADLWKFGGQAEHYRCYSLLYSLLAYMESLENQAYTDKNKLNIIAPALSYLKEHIYDCDLKTDILSELCGISGTYFRKIFQANYTVSPQKYILGKRLSHAKSIFDSGDFDTVSEVAFSVGYSDPLYFSRAFKKKYGISPSQYAKER